MTFKSPWNLAWYGIVQTCIWFSSCSGSCSKNDDLTEWNRFESHENNWDCENVSSFE